MERKAFLDGITPVIVRAEEVFSTLWIVKGEACISCVNDLPFAKYSPVRTSQTQPSILFNNEDRNAFFSQVIDSFDDLLLIER